MENKGSNATIILIICNTFLFAIKITAGLIYNSLAIISYAVFCLKKNKNTVNGISVMEQQEEIKRKIGYLPENKPRYKDMPVLEDLEFVAELQNVPAEKG